MEPVIAWIDVETTGVDPGKDALLEVACLVTDTQLNLLDQQGYHAVVRYTPQEVSDLVASADERVVQMHSATNLWGKLTSGKPLETIDTELLYYIRRFAAEPRQALVGGNSITLDRNFVERYLPETFAHLYYRSIDVSTVALLAQWRYGSKVRYEKQYLHAALPDIRESISELRYLLDKVFKSPDEFFSKPKLEDHA